jgi:hypothetical protein
MFSSNFKEVPFDIGDTKIGKLKVFICINNNYWLVNSYVFNFEYSQFNLGRD